jgi:hypothetical protein
MLPHRDNHVSGLLKIEKPTLASGLVFEIRLSYEANATLWFWSKAPKSIPKGVGAGELHEL